MNCSKLQTTMSTVIETDGAGFMGTSTSGTAGLSVYSSSGPKSVWFSSDVLTNNYTLSERERVVGHEAYHLAFLDSNETMADQVTRYCFGHTNTNPFVN